MAITISIDNNRNTSESDPLILDESSGVQPGLGTDDGNDVDVTLVSGALGGLSADFNTFLNGLSLSDAQKLHAATVDGASSASDFVKVTTTNDETISDLYFSDSEGNALDGDLVAGMTTLDGDPLYLWSFGDYAIATTSDVSATAGTIVAAFYLDESGDHTQAQVQMVTFEPLKHLDTNDHDDQLDFTDVLQVSASGTLSFKFDNLESGNFLWAAVGSFDAGLLVTGQDLNVVDSGGKRGDIIKGGSSDPSDSVNTSQGGINATIGINAQHFTDGPKVNGVDTDGSTAVLTLVTGYQPLQSTATPGQATGINVNQIDYGNYINSPGAAVFISQTTGNAAAMIKISLWEAGGGGIDKAPADLSPEEGFAYIGNQDQDANLRDDAEVNVGTVTITRGGTDYVFSGTGGTQSTPTGSITVAISGNDITLTGVTTGDLIHFTAADDPNSAVDGTFNRFTVQGLAGTADFDIGRVDVDKGVVTSEPVGDELVVEDDGPALSGQNASEKVVEDELSSSASPSDLSDGNADGDGESDEATFTHSELSVILNTGTDTPARFELDLDGSITGTAVKDVDGNAMTSMGVALTWNVNGTVVEAKAGNRVVFTITHDDRGTDNPTDDEFHIDLRDQIDHDANGDDGSETLNLTPAFLAFDADGDSADLDGAGDQEPIQLVVENDVPELSGEDASVKVVEDELSTSASPADHSDGNSDGDGESDEATLSYSDLAATVDAGSDEPVSFALDLDGSINGTAVKDVDGNAMTSKGIAITWNVNGNVVEAKAGGRVVFTITKDENGTANDPTDDEFHVDLRDQIDHDGSGDDGIETLNLTPVFTAEDFDGDTVDLSGGGTEETILLDVENDVPELSGQAATKKVVEDEMSSSASPADASDGNSDGDGESDEATYSYADLAAIVDIGADEPASFGLDLDGSLNGAAVKDVDGNALFSKGEAITWNVNGTVLEAKAGGRVVFTISKDANGTDDDPTDDSFDVDLRDQIDHSDLGDDGIETVNLTPAFTAEDHDGDSVDLSGGGTEETVRLVVENDVPELSGEDASVKVVEDELSTSASPADISDGNSDGDGDSDEATLTYADLAATVHVGGDEPVSFALDLDGSINGTAVKDAEGNAVTSQGVALTWNVNGTVVEAKAGSRVVFTITRDENGSTGNPTDDSFDVDLRDQIDHSDADGDDGIKTLDLTPAFTAEDFDGDAVDLSGGGTEETIKLDVENDVPAPKPNVSHSEEVHEDALTGGNPDGDGETEVLSVTYTKAELTALADAGADEDLSFSLNTAVSGAAGAIIGTNVVTTGGAVVQSKGVNVVWAAGDAPGSLKGVVAGTTTTVFTLTPSGNDFVFNLVDQVDHSGAEDDQELLPIDLTSAFKAVDFDKDPLTLNPDSVVLNVENDLPTFSSQIASKTLDWVDESSVGDSLNGRVGGDEPASYVIDKYTDLDGYSEDLSEDGKTLTYSKDGKVYFELKLDDAANSGAGGYTFTVKEPPPQEELEFNFDNLESGNFLWVAVGGKNTDGTMAETGLLVTGSRLNLNGDGTAVSGGKLASDQVNTSQGGAGATIGIDNQMFTPGDSGIFTFVKNYGPLATSLTGDATGQDIDQIAYTGYANINSASLFISQKQGNTKLDLTMSIHEAGTGSAGTNAQVDEEGSTYASGGNISGSGKNQVLNKSTTFLDDYKPDLLSVEIKDGANNPVGIWTTDEDAANANLSDNIYLSGHKISGGQYNGVQVTISGNSADINGVDAFYSIKMTAEEGETFNRIELAADNGKFDIGKFVLEEGQDTPDVDLEFSVGIEDKDGDLNNFNGMNDVFDDFKIKVDGTGQFDNTNTAPTGFSTSYDTASTLTSTALKSAGFVDDSGMAPEWASLDTQQDLLLM